MLFPTQTIEDYIIVTLRESSLSGPELLQLVQKEKIISKESFYRIMRKLLRDEVLVKNKTVYNLNTRWLEKLSEFSNKNAKSNIALDDGDQITYTFKNAESMYNYWAYLYDSLYKNHDTSIPLLLYHSHQWFIYAREEAEKIFFNRFIKQKQNVFLSIGGNSELEKNFKKEWSDKYLHINTGISYGLEKTLYINVIDDYIFKVYTSKKFADDIDTFFTNTREMDENAKKRLIALTERKDKTKLILKRSKKEAELLIHRYKKDFVF